MLISVLTLILISNALTTVREKAILYSRTVIISMIYVSYMAYNSLYIKSLVGGIGIYNGLFNVSIFTQSFNIFIFILTGIIAILTAFYPRNVYNIFGNTTIKSEHGSRVVNTNSLGILVNKNLPQFNIVEYALITLFIILGAVLLMSTGDLVSLFLSIELQSYGLYILATLYRDSESATSSGLTYFLLGGLSSCFILLGSSILYVNSGTTNLDNLFIINTFSEANNVFDSLFVDSYYGIFQVNYINVSLIILTVGLLFKISAAPFHFWSPDVYDGIPTIVTTFVAIVAKISLFVVLLELVSYLSTDSYLVISDRSVNGVFTLNYEWKDILIFSSLMSLIIGSILGLTQYRIKRLFAYSTISHVGFILLALSVNEIESIQGYIFYILQYSISNLNAFFILVMIGYSLYGFVTKYEADLKLIDEKSSPIQLLSQLKGYFYINSFLALSLSITLFSFVGIPPLIGFFAKQMVLSAALDKGYVFMTLVGVVTSVIGAGYYLNLIKLIFFSKSDYANSNIKNIILKSALPSESYNITSISSYLSIVVACLTMLISLFIFVPGEWFRIVSILSLSVFNI